MKKVKKIAIAAALFAMIFSAVVMIGCGSNSKEYLIVTDSNFPPFEYTDSKDEFTGIDVDIIKAVAEDQGFKYSLDQVGFNAAIAAVESGQADGVIAAVSITEERKEKLDFSNAYFDSTVCVAARKESTINSLDALQGKTAVVKQGTQSASWAESIKKQYGFKLKYYSNSEKMFSTLESGAVDVCFEDYPVIAYKISSGENLKVIAEETTEFATPLAFGVKKGENAELLKKFNEGLKNIKESGKYDEIITKYLKAE